MGKVEDYVLSELSNKGALFFGVIDPLDYKTPLEAVKAGKMAYENDADVILVGGSIGVQGRILDEVTKGIKDETDVPVVLFPGNIATITKYADAIYFMSLLNSRNPYWISQAQTLAAPVLKTMDVEPLSVGYIVVQPGGTVGWVGDANLIPRHKPKIAAALGLAAQYNGSRFLVTDVGSNPPTGPVPVEMVKAVSSTIDIPYVVAGGVNTPEKARNIISAGADIVQVGTVFEKESDTNKIKNMIDMVHKTGKERL